MMEVDDEFYDVAESGADLLNGLRAGRAMLSDAEATRAELTVMIGNVHLAAHWCESEGMDDCARVLGAVAESMEERLRVTG